MNKKIVKMKRNSKRSNQKYFLLDCLKKPICELREKKNVGKSLRKCNIWSSIVSSAVKLQRNNS